MKTRLTSCQTTALRGLFFALALVGIIAWASVVISCSTPPSARVVQVQTLKAVGQSAEAAVTLAANLYAAKQITGPQTRQVIDLYDGKFQPAFRVAVAAVNANMESFASPELAALAAQISALVASFAKPSTPTP